jgi:hypothetical protein
LAVHHKPAHAPAIVAGCSLVVVVLCAFWIQFPARLRVELGGPDLAAEIRTAGTPSAAMERVGSLHVDNYNANRSRLEPLQRVYLTGVTAFAVEVAALALVVL